MHNSRGGEIMRMKIVSLSIAVLLLTLAFALGVYTGMAGAPEPPGPPGSTSSYTLEDVYNRLDTGAAGTQSTFTEPSSGPGTGTMHSLDDIMGIAPAADNTSGALPAEVLAGKIFWSLRTNNAWGLQTGTAPAGENVAGPDGSKTFAIPDGFYSGRTATANDSDLVPGNVRSGANLFGVAGACRGIPATGQTTSYATGDDGTYQLGCTPAVSNPSEFYRGFKDNGDGTVTDNLTGLIWLKDANCDGTKTWANALIWANGLYDGCATCGGTDGDCGLSDGSSAGDWRLPNVNELRSLINPAQAGPALPAGHPFTDVSSSDYWTSSTYQGQAAMAWDVHLGGGHLYGFMKTQTPYVWPVRGGQ
jgi:hypothetical protein